jgi:hypothetical protein
MRQTQLKQGVSVIFGEPGMGFLPATLGIGSTWTRQRLLNHLRPFSPAPVIWRLSQLAPRITKSIMQSSSAPHRMKWSLSHPRLWHKQLGSGAWEKDIVTL